MPIALDLLPSFWKSLREEQLELRDLQEADCITYNLTQKMLDVRMCVGMVGGGGGGGGGVPFPQSTLIEHIYLSKHSVWQ